MGKPATQIGTELLNRAGALLMDAAGMLRMEAGEWRGRKSEPPKDWGNNYPTAALAVTCWSDKCERVAKINEAAADAMLAQSRKIAEAAHGKSEAA